MGVAWSMFRCDRCRSFLRTVLCAASTQRRDASAFLDQRGEEGDELKTKKELDRHRHRHRQTDRSPCEHVECAYCIIFISSRREPRDVNVTMQLGADSHILVCSLSRLLMCCVGFCSRLFRFGSVLSIFPHFIAARYLTCSLLFCDSIFHGARPSSMIH